MRNIVKTVSIAVFMYFVCWTPNEFIWVLQYVGFITIDYNGWIYRWTLLAQLSTCVVNPMIYAIKYKEIRQVYARLLFKVLPPRVHPFTVGSNITVIKVATVERASACTWSITPMWWRLLLDDKEQYLSETADTTDWVEKWNRKKTKHADTLTCFDVLTYYVNNVEKPTKLNGLSDEKFPWTFRDRSTFRYICHVIFHVQKWMKIFKWRFHVTRIFSHLSRTNQVIRKTFLHQYKEKNKRNTIQQSNYPGPTFLSFWELQAMKVTSPEPSKFAYYHLGAPYVNCLIFGNESTDSTFSSFYSMQETCQ